MKTNTITCIAEENKIADRQWIMDQQNAAFKRGEAVRKEREKKSENLERKAK